MIFFHSFSTQFGDISIIWKQKSKLIAIQRIFLSNSQNSAVDQQKYKFPSAKIGTNPHITSLVNKIQGFFSEEPVSFALDLLDFSVCSSFQKKVIVTEATIPRGRVSTYNLIANIIGKPNSSRAVARALATNPFPIIIPCHRTVRSDGAISGYQGGKEMKCKLLNMEGVQINSKLKINLQKFIFDF